MNTQEKLELATKYMKLTVVRRNAKEDDKRKIEFALGLIRDQLNMTEPEILKLVVQQLMKKE